MDKEYVEAMQVSAYALHRRLPHNCTELQQRSASILIEWIQTLIDELIAIQSVTLDHNQRHHLRNILTPILSYASLLSSGRTGDLPEMLYRYSHQVAQSVRDFNTALDTLRDNWNSVA
ncbi:MAG: hypothetical protein ACPG7F_01325 [Aggregatilineales bacterium]